MFEYKSELIKLKVKILRETINEIEISKFDELLNQRASEGWELVTHSLTGGSWELFTIQSPLSNANYSLFPQLGGTFCAAL